MTVISILSRLINGVQRNIDLSSNTLKVSALRLAGAGETYTDVDKTGYDAVASNASTGASHAASTSNPHSVTKAQVGLTNVTDNAQVKGLASGTTSGNFVAFGADGYTVADSGKTTSDFATAAHDHSGVYEPANSNIQTHIGSTSNPHSVTKSQVGLSNVTNDAQLALAGGTMSGFIALHADPTSAMHAATRQYVLTQIAAVGTAAEWQDSVLDRVSTPPGSPVTNGRYLVTSAGSNAITAVDTGTETFTVAGDQSGNYAEDDVILVKGSTGNNAYYTVVSATFDTDHTDIVVVEDITNATADGTIYRAGGAFSILGVDKIVKYSGTVWSVVATATTGTFMSVDDEPDGLYYFGGLSAGWTKKQWERNTAGSGIAIDVNGVVSASGISNSNIATDAGILYSKLSIASGDIALAKLAAGTEAQLIVCAVTTGIPTYVSVTGDVTIGSTGVTAIGSGRVTNAMLAGSIADSNLSQITTSNKVAGSAVQLKATSGLANDTGLRVHGADVAGNGLEAVTGTGNEHKLAVKLATNSGLTVDSNGLAVAQSSTKVCVAGEEFAANTTFLVRWAVNGETAGRVYKATNDTTSLDLFYVVGLAHSASLVSAGGNISVQSLGSYTLGSSDSAFGATDIGKPVYLTTAGGFSVTVPAASLAAAVQVGMVQETSKIWIQSLRVMGVNA